jgi:hypothetical protein
MISRFAAEEIYTPSSSKSGAAAVLVLAFVPVELLLQISLGVLDSRERTQRSRELLATYDASGDAWYGAEV